METESRAESPQSKDKKKEDNPGKLPGKNLTKSGLTRKTHASVTKYCTTGEAATKTDSLCKNGAKANADTENAGKQNVTSKHTYKTNVCRRQSSKDKTSRKHVKPVETKKNDTKPVERKDPKTKQVEMKDPDTQQVETRDPDTKPAETKDPDTQPVETRDPDTKPAEKKNPDIQPVETRDPDTQPAEIKDTDTQPDYPAETKDPDTQPVETKDPDIKPVETKDNDIKPVETKDNDIKPENTTKTNDVDTSMLDAELYNTDKNEICSDVPNVNESHEDTNGKAEPKHCESTESDEDSDEKNQKVNQPKPGVTIADMIDSAIHSFEEEEYMKCIVICEEILNTNWKDLSDQEKFSTAFLYMGKCYENLDELEKALKHYQFSLAVSKNLQLSQHVDEISFKLLVKQKQSAEEENKKANDCFKSKQFKAALAHYTEAIKRNPEQAKFYSNRSACYLKVKEYLLALSDAQNCIRIEPTSVKGYFREGAAYLALNKPSKACASYSNILQIDPENDEAKKQYSKSTERAKLDPNDPEAVKKRIEEEPELIQILNDPRVRSFLSEMEKDPTAVKKYMHDISTRKKIQKLLECGLLNAGGPHSLFRS